MFEFLIGLTSFNILINILFSISMLIYVCMFDPENYDFYFKLSIFSCGIALLNVFLFALFITLYYVLT